eukprot:GFKZ01010068.1.p2 GENE.GFKZ01010068.1~~GFKZ01010068.1.p2  ORF type:complete len:387 (+),score=41.21 GFKZ01010068.1:155-1162(+)
MGATVCNSKGAHIDPRSCFVSTPQCKSKSEESKQRRRRPARRPTAFENTIDDLTMKRMGRGTIYYGERVSSNDSFEDEEDDEENLLKPDPVLVAGATGRTGQWIALGLMNQGFNVRSFSRSFENAEKLFGPSGSNLDVFQGNLTNFDQVYDAVDGSVGVVCAAGSPWWIPGGLDAVDVTGVENLINASLKAGGISRFVLISTANPTSPRGKAKRRAEELLIQSGLPYVIFRATTLSNGQGGMSTISMAVTDDGSIGKLTRIDLAQAICQALVYDRAISRLKQQDPDAEFDFPNSIVNITNGNEPYVPDKRFWRREFNRISDACRDRTATDEMKRL